MSLNSANNMIVSRLLQFPENEWPPRTTDLSVEAHIKAAKVDFAVSYMMCMVKPVVSLNYKNAIFSRV